MDENTIEDLAFSFVCIVQNDADRLKPCYDRLKETAEGLGQKYEIIFVNDGSADGSLEGIRALAKLDGSVKYVDFSRAFGRSAAMAAAHDYADGQAVITLSSTAAMVECIPQLVAKWQAGAEMVYTVSDPAAGPEAADVAAACLLDRKVVSAIRGAREAGPKADGLLAWIGFKTAAVPCKDGSVSEPPRRVAARRGIVAAMRAAPSPLRLAAWTGALMLLAGAGCLAVGGALASLGWGRVWGTGVLLLGVSGAQLLCLAAVAQWAVYTLKPAEDRAFYVVRYAHGFQAEQGLVSPKTPKPKVEKPQRFNVLT